MITQLGLMCHFVNYMADSQDEATFAVHKCTQLSPSCYLSSMSAQACLPRKIMFA